SPTTLRTSGSPPPSCSSASSCCGARRPSLLPPAADPGAGRSLRESRRPAVDSGTGTNERVAAGC
ncbi:MAG: hypothetical protein AVDCRST_MAG59-1103, partial [uncultured Thermomicrobiales bacterium]